ncbi:hypothetical protein DFH09DRAFT_1328890 [Mycena vulgaris]|nr:hypothetical protein DFH09DRAFT_1328890 [Mycena vulgaris]
MSGKRKRARVAKEDGKNLCLWAEGAWEKILQPHVEPYGDAMERGWREERKYFGGVSREFHARVDWRLQDPEEPILMDFDPAAMLPFDLLSAEEEALKQQRLTVLDLRIRRWLKYRVKRLRKHVGTRLDSSKDPWAVLLAKLSGITAPPKARQAYQQFMREDYAATIDPIVKQHWVETAGPRASVPVSKEPKAPFRAKVVRELFAALSESEREVYGARVKADAVAAKAAYEKALKEQPSKGVEARHLAIENIGSFVAPIIQGIHERTGLHSVLILGGPMPKYGGDLRTIHLSYGRNKTAVGSHFPQWAKERFNGVLGLMKEYLETVFTKQDCVDSALPAGLEGAKYTITPEDSDNESSDSNTDSDSDETGSESDAPPRKKQKKASKSAKAVASTTATTSSGTGVTSGGMGATSGGTGVTSGTTGATGLAAIVTDLVANGKKRKKGKDEGGGEKKTRAETNGGGVGAEAKKTAGEEEERAGDTGGDQEGHRAHLLLCAHNYYERSIGTSHQWGPPTLFLCARNFHERGALTLLVCARDFHKRGAPALLVCARDFCERGAPALLLCARDFRERGAPALLLCAHDSANGALSPSSSAPTTTADMAISSAPNGAHTVLSIVPTDPTPRGMPPPPPEGGVPTASKAASLALATATVEGGQAVAEPLPFDWPDDAGRCLKR